MSADDWTKRHRSRAKPIRTVEDAVKVVSDDIRRYGESVLCVATHGQSPKPNPCPVVFRKALGDSLLKFLPALDAALGFPCVVEIGPPPFARVVPL